MRELSAPSENSLSGDLSLLGGWFEQGWGQTDKSRSGILSRDLQRSLVEEYRAATRGIASVKGEATAFITLPEESFRLQLSFFSRMDSSWVEYRSRAGVYSGTLIQSNGVLTHLTDDGRAKELQAQLPKPLEAILTTTLLQFYQLTPERPEDLRFDLSTGIRITTSEPSFLPEGYTLILEGYMQDKGIEGVYGEETSAFSPDSVDFTEKMNPLIGSKVLYLPKKITVQNPAEGVRIIWVHQRLTGTLGGME